MGEICIEIKETGERIRIVEPVWITRNRNGILITPHSTKALGVGDGERIWSFGDLEGYPQARIITLAEWMECQGEETEDPELAPEEALNILLGGIYETE